MVQTVLGGFLVVHGLITTMIGVVTITSPSAPALAMPSWLNWWPGPFGRSWLFEALNLGGGVAVAGGLLWLAAPDRSALGPPGPRRLMSASAATPARRRPVWSQLFTRPLASVVPAAWRPAVVAGVKGVHTALFVGIGAAIVVFVWDGLRGRPGRRSATAFGITVAESVIYLSNNQVCPFTPLAEELGAESGAVADLFLPDWASRRIPLVSTGMLILGITLNLRALLASRTT